MLNRCVCTTLALHTYISLTVDQCKSPGEAKLFEDMYLGLIRCAVAAMPGSLEVIMRVGGHDIACDRGGQVTGFRQCLQTLHSNVSGMLTSEWEVRHQSGAFSANITRETLSLQDVVSFVLTFARHIEFDGIKII